MAIVVPIVSEWNPSGIDRSMADIQKAEGGWAKAGVAVQKAAVPAGIALAGLATAGWQAAKAAEEAAAVNAKLSKVFDSMGYSENTQAALDYADALSKTIGVDDEVIKGAQTKLATFSEVAKSTETMAKATSLAADLSAAGFGSMDSAAVMLGKAIQDPVKGLTAMTRVGVTFTKQQEEQITALVEGGKAAKAQGIIMDAVAKQVGGVAEEGATSSAKLSVAFGEISESIGAALLPAMEAVMPYFMDLATWAQENGSTLAAIGAVIAALATTILALAAAMKALAIIKSVIALVKTLNLTLLTSPWFWVIAAVVLLAVIIYKNWDKIVAVTKTVMGWLNDFIRGIWDKIKGWTKAAWDWIKDAISKAWDFIKWVFLHTNPVGIIINYWDDIKRWTAAAWEWVTDKIKWAWDWIKALWRVSPLGMVITHLDDIKDAVGDVFQWIVDKAEWLWETLTDIFGKIGEGFDKVKGVVDAINPFSIGGGGDSTSTAGSVVTPLAATLADGVPSTAAYAVSKPSGGGTVININGALDADNVARQVKSILEAHDVRQGRSRGAARAVAW